MNTTTATSTPLSLLTLAQSSHISTAAVSIARPFNNNFSTTVPSLLYSSSTASPSSSSSSSFKPKVPSPLVMSTSSSLSISESKNKMPFVSHSWASASFLNVGIIDPIDADPFLEKRPDTTSTTTTTTTTNSSPSSSSSSITINTSTTAYASTGSTLALKNVGLLFMDTTMVKMRPEMYSDFDSDSDDEDEADDGNDYDCERGRENLNKADDGSESEGEEEVEEEEEEGVGYYLGGMGTVGPHRFRTADHYGYNDYGIVQEQRPHPHRGYGANGSEGEGSLEEVDELVQGISALKLGTQNSMDSELSGSNGCEIDSDGDVIVEEEENVGHKRVSKGWLKSVSSRVCKKRR
ncbi:hypothetical protein BGZ95_005487 [Linnemannia exigua]|uniref:Uncharacterized protein n=1 Tax=Linnemannia exigua TaxID=604196 RepID=A0AAD4DGP3_9FUNG|nr:hypothetical protein BGZ95_005487 [Linnemannia exigua]